MFFFLVFLYSLRALFFILLLVKIVQGPNLQWENVVTNLALVELYRNLL